VSGQDAFCESDSVGPRLNQFQHRAGAATTRLARSTAGSCKVDYDVVEQGPETFLTIGKKGSPVSLRRCPIKAPPDFLGPVEPPSELYRATFRQAKLPSCTIQAMAASQTRGNVPIRSVARAFQVLRLINEQHGLTLHNIHILSGLPKPTVFRLLHTLKHEGYIEPDGIRGVFRVAGKSLELCAGYTERMLIVKMPRQSLSRLRRKSSDGPWPSAPWIADQLSFAIAACRTARLVSPIRR
jgi:IclR helix-turn-helix domain